MSYTNKDKAFKIFLSAWKGNENSAVYERALIHEFIHAATTNQIDKNSKVNAQLKSIIDDLKSYAKNNQLDPALKEVVEHATENTYELIAYGLSDPSLQNLMQKIKASGDITIWDKLVRAISDMLGIELNEEQETALSALLMVGDSLLGDTKANIGKDGDAKADNSGKIEKLKSELAGATSDYSKTYATSHIDRIKSISSELYL